MRIWFDGLELFCTCLLLLLLLGCHSRPQVAYLAQTTDALASQRFNYRRKGCG
jgi:hypothetical protein